MKKIMQLLYMVTFTLTGALMTGCSNNDEIQDELQQVTDNIVTLTTTIRLDGGTDTRALDASGVKTFAAGDKVAVFYYDDTDVARKAVSSEIVSEDITADGKSAAFTIQLIAPKANSAMKIVYPADMVNGNVTSYKPTNSNLVNYAPLAKQDGTFDYIASNADVCTFDGSLTEESKLPEDIVLANQLVICKFTLMNAEGSDITSSINELKVFTSGKSYTVDPVPDEGPVWIAMLPVENSDIIFTATDGTNIFGKTVTAKTLESSNIYPIGLRLNPMEINDAMLTVPLTFMAKEPGAKVTFTLADYKTATDYYLDGIKYSTDGLIWNTFYYKKSFVLANAGDKVMFRGNYPSYYIYENGGGNYYSSITCDADCYIYGNMMSLVSFDDYATARELTESKTFARLFLDNTHILNHPDYPLLLPATKLSGECYWKMFSGCTGLTAAPYLPALTMASECYHDMFENCTSLTYVPDLPAMTLDYWCYCGMFEGCTSLVNPPALPATKLASGCYYSMFEDCTSLVTSPVLPDAEVDVSSYYRMFKGCTSLKNVICLSTSNDYYANSLQEWLDGVAETGTFYKAPSATFWKPGSKGIPEGWTIMDYNP